MSSYTVLGLGAACIDLLIPVDEAFLNQLSGIKGGAQPITWLELQTLIQNTGIEPQIATGGSCANTIKGLTHLGVPCALLAKLGADSFGQHFYHVMQQIGVTPLFSVGQQPNDCVLCLITPDGQRTMRFYSGSSQELTKDSIRQEHVNDVKLVHIDAYSLRNPGIVEHTITLAKQAGAYVSMDLSSFEIVHTYHARLIDLVTQGIDIIFANRDEVYALTDLPPKEGCQWLREKGCLTVVLLGAEGCLIGYQDRLIHSPTRRVPVVDTTGAGDFFASGFLYGFLKGFSLERCASIGHLLASTVIQIIGTEIPQETWGKIKHQLSLHIHK